MSGRRKSLSQQLISLLTPKPKEEISSGLYPIPEKEVYHKEEKRTLGFITHVLLTCKELSIDSKGLTVLVPEIGQLINLTTLNVSLNKLTFLPAALTKLVHLEILDVSDNQLSELPSDIGKLPKLDTLMCGNNNIQKIGDGVFDCPSLSTIYLNDNKLTFLSRKVSRLKNLVSLNLKNNKITKIPKEIILLEELKTLSLDGNEIMEAPIEILTLKLDIKAKLTKHLRGQIVSIRSMSQEGNLVLKNLALRSLNFSDSELSANITSVDLSENVFYSVPSELFLFEHLVKLNLSNNCMVLLNGISKITTLTDLDLHMNNFEEFPREILDLKNLVTLNIEGNPFIQPLPNLWLNLDDKSAESWRMLDKRIKRKQILDELLQTEKDYVANLKKIRDYYLPLEKTQIMGKDEYKFIFSPFQVILGVNEGFLRDLVMLINEHPRDEHHIPDNVDVGQLFLDSGFAFKLYTVYINEYTNVYDKFKAEMEKNKKFKEFWAKYPEFSEKSDIAKAISTYFILPIQRMPRYQLLLTEMKKTTPPDHSTYEKLCLGLKFVQEIAEYCNLKKAEREFMNRVGDIAQELNDPSLMKPSRLILYEVMQCKKIDDSKKTKTARICLFNDLFLLIEEGKMHKFENHYMTIEKVKDYYNRITIYSLGFEGLYEFENLTTLEELYELWYDECHRFWSGFFERRGNDSIDTQATSRVKNITNKRMSLKASSLQSLTGISGLRSLDQGLPSPKSPKTQSEANSPKNNTISVGDGTGVDRSGSFTLSSLINAKKLAKLKGLSETPDKDGQFVL